MITLPKALDIQEMFLTGKPQYPVERTLLISGALDALLESRYRGHVRIETPHLDVFIALTRRCRYARPTRGRPDPALRRGEVEENSADDGRDPAVTETVTTCFSTSSQRQTPRQPRQRRQRRQQGKTGIIEPHINS